MIPLTKTCQLPAIHLIQKIQSLNYEQTREFLASCYILGGFSCLHNVHVQAIRHRLE